MRVAVIAPTAMLEQFAITGFHLALAHQCLVDEKYTQFYKRRAAAGDYVMLDNSAYELGGSVDANVLRDIAEYMRPTAVFLPDIRFNTQATVEAVLQGIEVFKGLPVKKFAVPQGRNLREVLECYNFLMEHPAIDGFGFYEEIGEVAGFKDRATLLRYFEDHHLIDTRKHYHLLGMEDQTKAVAELGTFQWIYGIDSAKPVVYGLHGIAFSTDGPLVPYPHRPKDFFTRTETEFASIILHNIAMLLKWAQNGQ